MTDGVVFRLRSEGLQWRDIEGEVVALDIKASRYLAVNRSGAAVWSLLARGATKDELKRGLIDRFGIEGSQAEEHLELFLAALEERGLLICSQAE